MTSTITISTSVNNNPLLTVSLVRNKPDLNSGLLEDLNSTSEEQVYLEAPNYRLNLTTVRANLLPEDSVILYGWKIRDRTSDSTETVLSFLTTQIPHALNIHRKITRVKLLGEAAQRFTVVSGHSCNTSLVFSSTRITESLVTPSKRGTSLFLPFIFSCNKMWKIIFHINVASHRTKEKQ